MYREISHSIFRVTNLISIFLHWNVAIAASSSTMFFANVSQLVNTQASPKQPQSDTGSKIARYSVSGVMKIISTNANVVEIVFLIPKNRKIPIENSMADNIMPPNNGKKEGNGSTAFTKPEKMNDAAKRKRQTFAPVFWMICKFLSFKFYLDQSEY